MMPIPSLPRLWGFSLVLVAALASRMAVADPIMDVLDGWQYRSGDSPVGADGQPSWIHEGENTTDWKPLAAFTAPEGDARGFAWIRIPLPAGSWRDPTLLIAAMDGGAAEIYTTRRIYEVGRIHPEGREERVDDAFSFVPLDKADPGHFVYIRLQQSPRPTGLHRLVRLGNGSDLVTARLQGAIPALMVTGILLLLGVLALLGFLLRTTDDYLLHCGLFALCSATLVLGISDVQGLVVPISQQAWGTLTVVGAFFMIAALNAFMFTAILRERRPVLRTLMQLGFVFAALLSAAALFVPHFSQRFLLLIVLFVVGGVLLVMVVGLQEALRGNPEAKVFTAGLAAFFVVVSVDSLGALGIVNTGSYHTYVGLLALTLSLALVVVRRFTQLQLTLEQHARRNEVQHAQVARLSTRLAESARVLVGAVARLRESTTVQNSVVDRQAGTLQEILATAQEINQASRVAAERASAIMGTASQADEANRSVKHAVEEGLGGISAMGEEVAGMAARIRALEQRTRQIAGIVDTVKDLADQSNMLALNAAIEAVRSGESGKGFGIVAREMRSLADLSLQATNRIREVLASVNDGIREAADMSERSEHRIQASLRQLDASGQQLKSLSQIVQDANGNVRQISAAVGQQSAGVSQVFAALNDLSRQMAETVERLKETREAASSVEKVADAMSAALAETQVPAASELAGAAALQAA